MIASFPRGGVPLLAAGVWLLSFIVVAAFRLGAGKPAEALKAFGVWIAISGVFAALYAYRDKFGTGTMGDRVEQHLPPPAVQTSPPEAGSRGAVVKITKEGGQFVAKAMVNGKPVRMTINTAADSVVLKSADAAQVGIQLNSLSYTVSVDTGGTRTFAARVKLDRVSLGGLTVESVDALVMRPGALHQSMLGLSFLSRLRSYEFSGDQLLLRG